MYTYFLCYISSIPSFLYLFCTYCVIYDLYSVSCIGLQFLSYFCFITSVLYLFCTFCFISSLYRPYFKKENSFIKTFYEVLCYLHIIAYAWYLRRVFITTGSILLLEDVSKHPRGYQQSPS